MALTSEQQQDILAVLDQYSRSYHGKNLDKIFSLASLEISGFGSGPDEIVVGLPRFKEQIKRDLSQAETVSICFDILKLDGQMPFAWITAFCTFDVRMKDTKLSLEGRMTALLRNTGSRWLFEQVHFSLPCGGQESGQSYPVST